MSVHKKKVLVPEYLNQFKCIGPECEDTCCVGWSVDIDKATYQKYRNVKDPELRPKLDKVIKRNRSNQSDSNYAKIKLTPEKRCPLLQDDQLCEVHGKLGEESLSTTCATYPRISNVFNGELEKSATMSCPEAARLALLNREKMAFSYIEEPSDTRKVLASSISKREPVNPNDIKSYMWDLRIFTIQVLQNRNYKLYERIIILGMFYQKVQEKVEDRRVQETLQLIETYNRYIQEGAFSEYLSSIPTEVSIQMEFLKSLIDIRYRQGVNSERYIECLKEFLEGLDYQTGKTNDELLDTYNDAYENHFKKFIAVNEYILENYLVNYVFKNLFPIGDGKGIYDNFVGMVLHYALIRIHLIGMARYHRMLTTDHAIKLIQSFAKVVEHNKSYMNTIINNLKKNNYTSMAYLVIIIKN